MNSDLQQVIDAIERAKQAPDPLYALIPGTDAEFVIRAIAKQTSATNAAVLAWLEYEVKREQEQQ